MKHTPVITESNCTLVANTSKVSYQNENATEVITLEYACMETDPYWGGFTLSFMAIPGVILWILFSIRQRISSCIRSQLLLARYCDWLGSLHKLHLHLGVGRWSEKC